METLTNKRQHGGQKQTVTNKRQRRSDSPAAAGPRWLLLKSCIDDEGGGSSAADAKTKAASCTSSGKPFSISFGIAAPPACCSLHFDWLLAGGTPCDSDGKHPKSVPMDVCVIAGHDNALLIDMTRRLHPGFFLPFTTTFHDYFVYEAGCGARPPSLSLLPGFYVPVQEGYSNPNPKFPELQGFPMVKVPPALKFRHLGMENTAILRRGEDDLVVCQFEMSWGPLISDMVDLCMLRLGRNHDWIVKRVPIADVEHRQGRRELQPSWGWTWRKYPKIQAAHAVPVGNRFLCWVDYSTGFIVCDVACWV